MNSATASRAICAPERARSKTPSAPEGPAERISDEAVAVLRERVLESLSSQGFMVDDGRITSPSPDKQVLRSLHAQAVHQARDRAKASLARHESRLLSYFARGAEVSPSAIEPTLRMVVPGSTDELLFRYARLHWSIPVSAGYGRRLRFLVLDRQNDKLIGLIGLGDPVIRLGPRDRWIGWDAPALAKNLRHVMDAFVLGAVPPYSRLLCGKLVAMLATSTEVREAFSARYAGTSGRISGEPFSGDLALITTQSALGRSSLYNRLRIPGGAAYVRVGRRSGSGEFHFASEVYADLRELVCRYAAPTAKHPAWGQGFRNRREVVRRALKLLDLDPDLVYHGVRREIYCVPLASNSREFLRGEADVLDYWTRGVSDIGKCRAALEQYQILRPESLASRTWAASSAHFVNSPEGRSTERETLDRPENPHPSRWSCLHAGSRCADMHKAVYSFAD